MRVTDVQALVKYSVEVKGAWVTVELGGTASLTNSEETLENVSDELHKRLTKQLKVLWASNKAGGGETPEQARTETKPETQENWCTTHNTEFKKFSKDGKTWFSHRTADGWHKQGK
jgi:hypothetical protein